jgi:hypothetical protein
LLSNVLEILPRRSLRVAVIPYAVTPVFKTQVAD